MNHKNTIIWGAIMAMLAVGIGAFGAHGLKELLEANGYLPTFETGVKYHFYHALGLLIVGILQKKFPQAKLLASASVMMLLGIFIFSGTLYALALTEIKWLGAITPIGGLGFIFAWGLIAWDIRRAV